MARMFQMRIDLDKMEEIIRKHLIQMDSDIYHGLATNTAELAHRTVEDIIAISE